MLVRMGKELCNNTAMSNLSVVLNELPVPVPLPMDLNADQQFRSFRKTLAQESSDSLDNGLNQRQQCGNPSVEAATSYLPFSLALTHAIRREMAPRTFKWRSGFAKNKNEQSCSGIPGYDFAMMNIQLAYCLHNQAHSVIRAASTVDMFDTASRDASILITKAAGIIDYVREHAAPTILRKPELAPLELEPDFTQALSSLFLGNAQHLAIRKAMLKGTGMSLVAKLSMDVALRMEGCLPVLQDKAKTHPSSAGLAQHAAIMGVFHRFLAAKLLGRECYSKDDYGLAESYMKGAMDLMGHLTKMKKDCPQYNAVIEPELSDVPELYAKYKKDNDLISMEKVKPMSELTFESKAMSKATPFVPPEPLFTEWKLKEKENCAIM